MFEIKLDKVLGNERRLGRKKKAFDSAYALWKFYEDERPGILEGLKICFRGRNPSKSQKDKKIEKVIIQDVLLR